MKRWIRIRTALLPHARRRGSVRSEAVAREAIKMLREAELDFHRSGQLGLSRVYRERAARLERELTA